MHRENDVSRTNDELKEGTQVNFLPFKYIILKN